MMIYGYIHAYKKNRIYYKQLEIMQRQQLDKIIEDINSFNYKNSQLELLIKQINKGDKLIITSLSSFNMSNTQLIPFLKNLFEEKIDIKIIDINFDSSKNNQINFSKLVYELEKSDKLVKSRKNSNTINKKSNRGKPAISEDIINQILEMRSKKKSYTEIQRKLGISRMTISKYIKRSLN